MNQDELWVLNMKLTKDGKLLYKPLKECEIQYNIKSNYEGKTYKGTPERGKRMCFPATISEDNYINIICGEKVLKIPICLLLLDEFGYQKKSALAGACDVFGNQISLSYIPYTYNIFDMLEIYYRPYREDYNPGIGRGVWCETTGRWTDRPFNLHIPHEGYITLYMQ